MYSIIIQKKTWSGIYIEYFITVRKKAERARQYTREAIYRVVYYSTEKDRERQYIEYYIIVQKRTGRGNILNTL